MINLNKHIAIPIPEQDAFHSSGFAKVASGNRVGTVSRDTFAQRRQADINRRVISNYRQSNIGQNYATSVANPTEPSPSEPVVDYQPKA